MIDPAAPYPAYDVQNPDRLLALLGRLWAETYAGRATVRKLLQARGEAAEQTYQMLREEFASLGRPTVPVFDRSRWHALVVRRSAVAPVDPAYDAPGLAYDGPGQIAYDRPAGGVTVPAPAWLAAVGAVTDGVADPTVMWVGGLEARLAPRAGGEPGLTLPADPFALSASGAARFATRDLPDGDAELTLWLFQVLADRDRVYRRFGYAVGLPGRSSEAYKAAVNAAFDALTGGPARAQVDAALAAATGIPLAGTAGEVVERVETFGPDLWVVTDTAAYRFAAAAAPLVAAGDVLAAGQALTDGLLVEEPGAGAVPAGWPALAAGPGLLAADVGDELTFPDAEVPWAGGPDEAGRLRLECELGGHPLAVEAFWDEVHRRGVAAGRTLAETLDRRPAPDTPTELIHVPPTVNPFGLLADSALRYGVVFARVRAACVRRPAGFPPAGVVLRRLVPPEAGLLVRLELDAGGAAAAPPAGTAGAYTAAAAGGAPAPATGPPDSVARPVPGTC